MTTENIKDRVFEIFKENNIETNLIYTSDNFTYNEFKVNGIRHWKFGLWIFEDSEKCCFTVSLFGQHEDYIDKFKPSCSPGCLDLKTDIYDIEYLSTDIIGFIDEVVKIQKSPLRYMYFCYGVNCHNRRSFVKYIFDWFKFYKIEYPIRQFLTYEGNVLIAKIISLILHLKNNKIRCDIRNNRGEFSYPGAELEIIVPDDSVADEVDSVFNTKMMEKLSHGFDNSLDIYYTIKK